MEIRKPNRERHLYNLRRHTFPASNFRQQAHCQQIIYKTNLNRFEFTTINEMKPPKRQRKQSAKSQMTQGSGPKRQKNFKQTAETRNR